MIGLGISCYRSVAGTPLILSISDQDSEPLTVESLLGVSWEMVHWPVVRPSGHFLLWANLGHDKNEQLADVGQIILYYLDMS